jgi:hypothetical protein
VKVVKSNPVFYIAGVIEPVGEGRDTLATAGGTPALLGFHQPL